MSLILVACGTKQPVANLSQASITDPPETVTLHIKNYRPQSGNVHQNLFVSNFSVKVSQSQLHLSTARDGMSDEQKLSLGGTYGLTTLTPESTVTGFADLLLFSLGLTLPQQGSLHCASLLSSTNEAFTYNDTRLPGGPQTVLGLRDCEKVYLGLDPLKFDNAGNGIPDSLKLRCGLNPTNTSSAYISTAGDGVANIDKCKRNIPLDESAFTQANQLFAYKYQTQANSDGSTDFTISNVPVLNHGADNFIAFYVTETSLSSSTPSLYTAFAILKDGYNGRTLNFDYWATTPSQFVNQQIQTP